MSDDKPREDRQEPFEFGFQIRPALRLSRVEEILRDQKIIDPIPCRETLANMIRKGTLQGKVVRPFGFIVYEESLRQWVKSFAERKKNKRKRDAPVVLKT